MDAVVDINVIKHKDQSSELALHSYFKVKNRHLNSSEVTDAIMQIIDLSSILLTLFFYGVTRLGSLIMSKTNYDIKIVINCSQFN